MNLKKFFFAGAMLLGISPLASQTVPKLAGDGIDLVAGVYYSSAWDSDQSPYNSGGLYRFDVNSEDGKAIRVPALATGGVTYHNGLIYQNLMADDGAMDNVVPKWEIIDYKTGETLLSKPMGQAWENASNSLTYDVTTDKIFALARTNFNDFYLAEITPATGEWKNNGTLSSEYYCYSAIACNKYGELYAIAAKYATEGSDYFLVRINPTDARQIEVGKIAITNNFAGDIMLMMSTKSALFFNLAEDKLYWIFHHSSLYLGSECTQILEMNIDNGKGTRVGYLAHTYALTGAFFTEPLLTAPDTVSNFTFDNGGTLSCNGTFSFTAPTHQYGWQDDAIEGMLTVNIYEGDSLLYSFNNIAPGSNYTSAVCSLEDGTHNLMVKVMNQDGVEGPAVHYKKIVGYDLPYYPSNAVLRTHGQAVTVTWDAPTKGLNGGEIDHDNITYRIVRFPDNIVLATDYDKREYTETVDMVLQNYYYVIVARYKGKDGYAIRTNTMVAGEPLDLPYENDFSDFMTVYNEYVVIDANKDNSTFVYDAIEGQMNMRYDYSLVNDADDWFITPPFKVVKGGNYHFEFSTRSSYRAQLEQIEVTFGMGNSIEKQQVIERIDGVPYEQTDLSFSVKATESGIGFFGIHIYSKSKGGYLRLYGAKITSTSAVKEVFTNDTKVWTNRNAIMLANPHNYTVEVYDITGKLRHTTQASDATIALPQGVYLVKSGNQTLKVVI